MQLSSLCWSLRSQSPLGFRVLRSNMFSCGALSRQKGQQKDRQKFMFCFSYLFLLEDLLPLYYATH